MTIAKIQKEVRNMDPQLSGTDPAFHAAVVMMSALEIGQDVRKLARFTHVPLPTIREIAARLRAQGLWKNGTTYHSGWDDPESGGVAFWLDVSIALGYLQRTQAAPTIAAEILDAKRQD